MLTPYWKWDAIIPEPLLKQLDAECASLSLQKGTLHGENFNPEVRKSSVAAFPGWHWFSGVLHNYAIFANESGKWGRTLVRPEATQIARYEASEYYHWHIDINPLSAEPLERKLTVICVLSEPQDYEGGALELRPVKEGLRLKRGSVVVFPSVVEHRVTPVLRGVRRSATCWAMGPNTW